MNEFATRVVNVCRERRLFWSAGQSAGCTDRTHPHERIVVHQHRDVVALPDDTEVIAVSFDPAAPYDRATKPDFGLYLDPRWQPPWAHEHVVWPDYGLPDDPEALGVTLRALLERARAGERVEVGCLGGHGRTGTLLAYLAVLTGVAPAGAVAWVREHYCALAAETDDQEAFVAALLAG